MRKILKTIFWGIVIFLVVLVIYFFSGRNPEPENITWGVNFSQMQAEALKLDWKQVYSSIITDLGARNIKILVQWDWIEGKKGNFYFDDIDWQVAQAEARNVSLVPVIGQKTGRWPECHIPDWASTLTVEQRQQELLKYLKEFVLRYRNSKAIIAWQVENEPLFTFGTCPNPDINFLKQEVALVKSLDLKNRPVIVSDSGEWSTWFEAAKIGDVVATTLYKRVWSDFLNQYFNDPFPPLYYGWKAELINLFFHKKVECLELQAEPWTHVFVTDASLQEQAKTMNLNLFRYNVDFAKKTGIDTFYFWGSEWWYWMKTKHSDSSIWNEARKILSQNIK